MPQSITFSIYSTVDDLPADWDRLALSNIFLSKDYLSVLQHAAPSNMQCFFIGVFKKDKLEGTALCQYLNLRKMQSFGERDRGVKSTIRNFVFKNFASNVLVLGNNMLTGQNALSFSPELNWDEGQIVLTQALEAIRRQISATGQKVHLTIWKDFSAEEISSFNKKVFNQFFLFETQPNMIFTIRPKWKQAEDYVSQLIKKYRDQYKRSRKKAEGLEKRKLHLDDIIKYQKVIDALYLNVANAAPFNTFFLPEGHFVEMKKYLQDRFLFYGYFLDENLVGFNTLITNGSDIDTYFLGYDTACQKEKMLYLNMLYDMIAFSVNKGYKAIILARTALEIKSSVGATPMRMFGFIKHRNYLINQFMPKLFNYFEPDLIWQQRHPFKD